MDVRFLKEQSCLLLRSLSLGSQQCWFSIPCTSHRPTSHFLSVALTLSFFASKNPTVTMKLLLLFTLTTMAAGFSPDPAVVSTRTSNKMTTTVLRMSSSSSVSQQPPRSSKKDDWSNKPRYQQKSTKPVAVKKVGWLQKQSIPDTMIQPNYFLTWAFALLGPLIIWYHPCKFIRSSPSEVTVIFQHKPPLSLFPPLPPHTQTNSLRCRWWSLVDWCCRRTLSHALCHLIVGPDCASSLRL